MSFLVCPTVLDTVTECVWRRSIIRFTIRLNVCAFASFWVERKHKQKTEAFVVNSNWNELKIVRMILQLDLLD